uniref:Uncharacterized protein n=2 Tax=unclassified Caudoviricetes TaxID=2788787 RepID=A0A8S5S608_9CAUD|nr:MAG TPA: hypothetical protein [Podoviridae sp. ct5O42]DAF46477.1 MAG TPA: hypothetical protein [Siphoviridae sp. ctdau33]
MLLQGFFGGDCWTRTSDLLRVNYGAQIFTTILDDLSGFWRLFYMKL